MWMCRHVHSTAYPSEDSRVAGGAKHQARNFRFGEGRPRRGSRGGALVLASRAVPRGRCRWRRLRPLVELDEAAAEPVRLEFRRTDLEVDVGLAARFRDLAPAGADLVTRAGIDPVIGSLVGGLVDRDDGKRRSHVERLERAGRTPIEGEGAEGDRHRGFFRLFAGTVPAMSRVGDRNGAAVTAGSGRSANGGPGGGKIRQRSGREEVGPLPEGETFSPDRLGAVPAGSRALRDMPGTGLRKQRQGTGWRISEAPEPGCTGGAGGCWPRLKDRARLSRVPR